MRRIVTCLAVVMLCAAGSLAQPGRRREPAKTGMAPGYYFTIGMCRACLYGDWHRDAIRLFKAKGIRAVMGKGNENRTSTQPFAPIKAFQMRFDPNVGSDSELLMQIELYVGPFDSEEAALRALDDFPDVLAAIQRTRNKMDGGLGEGWPIREGERVTHSANSNSYEYGFFFIQGYALSISAMKSRDSGARQTGLPSHILPSHRAILQNWLAGKPGWRAATKADAYIGVNKDAYDFVASQIRDMSNHPYYVADDFNGDGVQDFAATLIRKIGRSYKYAVIIFNGPLGGGRRAAPTFYTEQVDAGDWLFWMKDDQFGNRIIVGPPASDAGYIIKPRGRGYVVN